MPTKMGRPSAEARMAVLAWKDACSTVDTSSALLMDAVELARWVFIMLAAAAIAGCRTLLSGDMQDGFTWLGVMVRNPFMQVR
jgi:predicted nucleic acid-binding protein